MILFIILFKWLFGLGDQILEMNQKVEFNEEGSNLYFTVSIIISFI